jgi:hypothetical protein
LISKLTDTFLLKFLVSLLPGILQLKNFPDNVSAETDSSNRPQLSFGFLCPFVSIVIGYGLIFYRVKTTGNLVRRAVGRADSDAVLQHHLRKREVQARNFLIKFVIKL